METITKRTKKFKICFNISDEDIGDDCIAGFLVVLDDTRTKTKTYAFKAFHPFHVEHRELVICRQGEKKPLVQFSAAKILAQEADKRLDCTKLNKPTGTNLVLLMLSILVNAFEHLRASHLMEGGPNEMSLVWSYQFETPRHDVEVAFDEMLAA